MPEKRKVDSWILSLTAVALGCNRRRTVRDESGVTFAIASRGQLAWRRRVSL